MRRVTDHKADAVITRRLIHQVCAYFCDKAAKSGILEFWQEY